MTTYLQYLLPWEFGPSWLVFCAGGLWLYYRGLLRRRNAGIRHGVWRPLAFTVGMVGIYAVTQTHYDYLAQYMFFTHRIQHLVLHHAAPFLIALAVPWPVLQAGLPSWRLPETLRAPGVALLRWVYVVLQNPVLAPVLFVGLIYFWLIPSVHFDAMLSHWLYSVMNWSMAIDGILFWWLMLDPVTSRGGLARLGFGARLVILWLVMVPQIALGAYIALSDDVLFDVYAVCGRAWPLAPLTDQQIGGLVTWIPAAMMSALGILVLIGYWLSGRGDDRRPTPNAEMAH